MSVKKLGFGLMRLPAVDEADKSKVDVERVCHLADRFLAEGFTYFDTAARDLLSMWASLSMTKQRYWTRSSQDIRKWNMCSFS